MIEMRLAPFFGRSIAATLMLALAAYTAGGNSTAQAASVSSVAATQDAAVTREQAPAESTQNSGGEVRFSAAKYSVAQDDGWAHLTLERIGPFNEAVEVKYSTVAGTAVAGSDFASTSGVVTWAENDSTPKVIAVPVYHVLNPFSGTKTFGVVITEPDAFAHIAGPDEATVTINGDEVAAIGEMELSSSSYAVGQGAGKVTVTVNRVGGSSGAVSVAYATANGTATAGTNFTAATGTLDWADGDASSKSFTVSISNATPFSGSKAFIIALSRPSGGVTLGSPVNANVTITGDATPAAGSLHMASPSYGVNQDAGKVMLKVERTGGSKGEASIQYVTDNSTAMSGTDFTAASGTLHWANGDATERSFSVAISNAKPFSGNKAFKVRLFGPSTGARIIYPGSAMVTIAGDAVEPVGSLELSASSYSVRQSAGSVTVTVNRAGGSSGAVSVAYATSSGTAVSGTDFTAASGTLDWASGDSSSKRFSVAISNVTPFSGNKSFTVSLSKSSGGATLGNPTSARVVIAGDAVAAVGSLQLSSSSYTVDESAGTLKVTVHRTGGSSGAVSVAYATVNGTAVAGKNFTATSGALDWASGDASSKSFSVAINAAAALSGSAAFTVELSSPSGGATLSAPSHATVTIEGDSGVRHLVPTNVVATPWPTQALVSFTLAAAPSGKSIVSYTVTGAGAPWITATAPTSPIMTQGGWSANSPNNFTVHANYSDGTKSAESTASNKVFPTLPPGVSSTSPYIYWDGVFYWGGDYSFGSGAMEDYADTTGEPTKGADFMIEYSSSGGWQPFGPNDAYDLRPYKYLIFEWKSSMANDPLTITSEVVGDKLVGNAVVIDDSTYGPTPRAGVWGTYKVPLSALGIGAPAGIPILYKLSIQNKSGTFARREYFQQVTFSAD